MTMPFGIDISGAITEIGKAVFFLYLRGKLRDACHDRYKEITARYKFTVSVFSLSVCQSDLQNGAEGDFSLTIAQRLAYPQYWKTTGINGCFFRDETNGTIDGKKTKS